MRHSTLLLATTAIALSVCCGRALDERAPSGAPAIPGTGKADRAAGARAHFACESDSSICVVDGDEPVWGERGARIYLARAERESERAPLQSAFALSSGLDAWGAEERWDEETRRALTYCVDQNSLSDHAARVADAFTEASVAWERAADVDLVHLAEHDDACDEGNEAVLFRVELAPDDATYWARAFYPSFDPSERRVRVNLTKIERDTPGGAELGFSLAAVLRHEIGHVLGFRHEHARRSTDRFECFEDPEGIIALTPYDFASVMHYPQCGGLGDYSYELSPLDRAGARFQYPAEREAAWWSCPTPLFPDSSEACAQASLQIARFGREAPLDRMLAAGLDERSALALLEERDVRPIDSPARLAAVAGEDAIGAIAAYLFGGEARCEREIGERGRIDASCAPIVNDALALANRAPAPELTAIVGGYAARAIIGARPIVSIRALEAAAGLEAQRAIHGALRED